MNEPHDDRAELQSLIDAGQAWLDRARLVLADLDAGPDGEPEWLVGGRRELTRALGRSSGYGRYVERLAARGELEFRVEGDQIAIRLRDPVRHAETRRLLYRGRAVRGRQGLERTRKSV